MSDDEADFKDKSTTVLYGFAPRAIGTGQVEHLQSHLLNLAFEHRVTPKKLVDRVIRPLCSTHSRVRTALGWATSHGNPMLGLTSRAAEWIEVLERSTGRSDLGGTTLFPLHRLVNGEHLLVKHLQHCPACYELDMAQGQRPYRRLLWQVKHVKCCPVHRINLIASTCGNSPDNKVRPAERVNLGGICADCGSIGFKCLGVRPSFASVSDLWAASQVQDLLANSALISEARAAAVKESMLNHAQLTGGLAALAARAGIAKSVFWRWIHLPAARMSLGQCLKVAAGEGMSLVGLLIGDPTRKDVVVEIHIERARKARKEVDLPALKARLQRAIDKPVPLKSVADEFEVSTELVRRHFPELVTELTRLFEDLKFAQFWEVRLRAFEEVEHVLLTLWRQGRTPTLRNARELTGSAWFPSSLKSRIFNSLRTEFGWTAPRYPENLEFSQAMLFKIGNARVRLRAAMNLEQGAKPGQLVRLPTPEQVS